MSLLSSQLRSAVKTPIRRNIIDPVKRSLDDWRLHRAVQELRESASPYDVLETIRRVWGNEFFSADIAYIRQMASLVEVCHNPILECGSGVTTIIAAVLAEKRDVTVWSLEQDQEWARFVEQRLARCNIHNVQLGYAALRKVSNFVWYEIDGLELPESFDLVICDGPFVSEQWGAAHAEWRYGVVPVLATRGIRFRALLLDDANEPRAENVLRRWHNEFDLQSDLIRSPYGDCALVRPGH